MTQGAAPAQDVPPAAAPPAEGGASAPAQLFRGIIRVTPDTDESSVTIAREDQEPHPAQMQLQSDSHQKESSSDGVRTLKLPEAKTGDSGKANTGGGKLFHWQTALVCLAVCAAGALGGLVVTMYDRKSKSRKVYRGGASSPLRSGEDSSSDSDSVSEDSLKSPRTPKKLQNAVSPSPTRHAASPAAGMQPSSSAAGLQQFRQASSPAVGLQLSSSAAGLHHSPRLAHSQQLSLSPRPSQVRTSGRQASSPTWTAPDAWGTPAGTPIMPRPGTTVLTQPMSDGSSAAYPVETMEIVRTEPRHNFYDHHGIMSATSGILSNRTVTSQMTIDQSESVPTMHECSMREYPTLHYPASNPAMPSTTSISDRPPVEFHSARVMTAP